MNQAQKEVTLLLVLLLCLLVVTVFYHQAATGAFNAQGTTSIQTVHEPIPGATMLSGKELQPAVSPIDR